MSASRMRRNSRRQNPRTAQAPDAFEIGDRTGAVSIICSIRGCERPGYRTRDPQRVTELASHIGDHATAAPDRLDLVGRVEDSVGTECRSRGNQAGYISAQSADTCELQVGGGDTIPPSVCAGNTRMMPAPPPPPPPPESAEAAVLPVRVAPPAPS